MNESQVFTAITILTYWLILVYRIDTCDKLTLIIKNF